MSFLDKFLVAAGLKEQPNSAHAAKERLMVTVSHQRRHRHSPDYLPMLEKDILAAIAKYVEIEEDCVTVRFDRREKISTLEVNVDLPSESSLKVKAKKILDPSDDIITPAKGLTATRHGHYKLESRSERKPEHRPEHKRVRTSVFAEDDD